MRLIAFVVALFVAAWTTSTASSQAPGPPVLGGKVSPDTRCEIRTDLPTSERAANTGGRDGAGLCVFTSIQWAARWQGCEALFELQKYMKTQPGGGYPEKVDAVLKKIAPGVRYVQHTGGDMAALDAIVQSGRVPCITYAGRDPHYGKNKKVAHMVCLWYLDQKWACVADNNFVDDAQFVWMSREELESRWKDMSGGWVVCLLDPPPPPVPCNGRVR